MVSVSVCHLLCCCLLSASDVCNRLQKFPSFPQHFPIMKFLEKKFLRRESYNNMRYRQGSRRPADRVKRASIASLIMISIYFALIAVFVCFVIFISDQKSFLAKKTSQAPDYRVVNETAERRCSKRIIKPV